MNLPTHLVANLAVAIPLKYILGLSTANLLIFISWGALIDTDHLLYFAIKYKTANPKKWYAIARKSRKKMQANLYVFHSPEFNLILAILGIFNHFFLLFLLSNAIHLSLDVIEHYQYHKNLKWLKQWSIIYSLHSLRRQIF